MARSMNHDSLAGRILTEVTAIALLSTLLARTAAMSSPNLRHPEPRRRVQYRVGGRMYPGDLVFEGLQPVLVVSWRTIDSNRAPYISCLLDVTQLRPLPSKPGEYVYNGDLLRTGRITSHPAPWTSSRRHRDVSGEVGSADYPVRKPLHDAKPTASRVAFMTNTALTEIANAVVASYLFH